MVNKMGGIGSGKRAAVLMTEAELLAKEEAAAAKGKTKKKPLTYAQLKQEKLKIERQLEITEKTLEYGSRCIICGEMKLMTETTKHFFKNHDPICKNPATSICRACAAKIARRAIIDGIEKEPTKDSVKQALFYLNKPFLEKLWDRAMEECHNEDRMNTPEDVWKAYTQLVFMPNYSHLTFMDSEGLGSYKMNMEIAQLEKQKLEEKEDNQKKIDDMAEDVKSTFLMNKKTTIRFLGYDPFENDPIDKQPILYAKLVSYFDDSVRDDGLKLEAVIQIVQTFKDIEVIEEQITKENRRISEDPTAISNIKSLTAIKQGMITSALALAKDNGISVNHNKNSRKGAGTLSGIIKEMSEMNLDDAAINVFDYETSQAMAQVEANSIKNILTQLNPDENDWQREVARQAELLFKLQDERDKAVEYCRLLRKENKDLKDFLQEKNYIDADLRVLDDDIVSVQGGDADG